MCGNHNHNSKNSKSMMWMMIPCLILVGVLFLGGGKLSEGGYLWPVIIGVFVIAHVWMMFKGHGGHGDIDAEEKTDGDSTKKIASNEHKHGSNCH